MNSWLGAWFLLMLVVSCLSLACGIWTYHYVVRQSRYWQRLQHYGQQLRRRQLRQQNAQQARFALPACMDTLAMLLAAGYPISSALQQVVQQANEVAVASRNAVAKVNPLYQQLALVLARVRRGESLGQALAELKQSLPGAEVAMFVSLLIQANQYGGRLSELLTAQAELRRQQIAEEIETKAQEAPVRLLFPLIMFIFPATLLPFIGVIIGKVMWPN